MRSLFSACCLWLVITASATAQVEQADQARLKQALHLNAQQMIAWQMYQSVTAPDPQEQAREAAAQRLLPQLATPRRISLIEAVMEDRLADFHRRATGNAAFYGQLGVDQQRIFDQITSPTTSPDSRD